MKEAPQNKEVATTEWTNLVEEILSEVTWCCDKERNVIKLLG